MNLEEDLDALKHHAEEICMLIKEKYPEVKTVFNCDDHITLMFSTGIQITLDFDIQWCRIHREWVLQAGIDLFEYWIDVKKCSEVIINHLDNLIGIRS